MSRQSRLMLLALAGASLCVLLIACANLASLLLARAVQRQRELAVRVAMGARPRRIARQVLTESLVLSAGGGAGRRRPGVGWRCRASPRWCRRRCRLPRRPTADLRMLAVAALATLATGLGFGLVPAWRIGRGSRGADLRQGSRVFGSQGTEHLRSTFVDRRSGGGGGAAGRRSGLFLRAMWRVQDVDPGFRAAGVVTARTVLPVADVRPGDRPRAVLHQGAAGRARRARRGRAPPTRASCRW